MSLTADVGNLEDFIDKETELKEVTIDSTFFTNSLESD